MGANQIVMTIPVDFRHGIRTRVPQLTFTFDALASAMDRAKKCVKIFCPYVDPTFTGLIQNVRCPVRVVSAVTEGYGASPVLERCTAFKDLVVRYLIEKRGKTQLFQMHAKMVLVDGEVAYVGSANLTDTSVHYNLELGILTEDPEIVAVLERTFDFFFDCVAISSGLLGR